MNITHCCYQVQYKFSQDGISILIFQLLLSAYKYEIVWSENIHETKTVRKNLLFKM